MDASAVIRQVKRRGGWTLRALAVQARTSHPTLSAYQQGRIDPSLGTLNRIVRASGFDVDARLTRRIGVANDIDRGDELAAVLRLAEQFPVATPRALGAARFGI